MIILPFIFKMEIRINKSLSYPHVPYNVQEELEKL